MFDYIKYRYILNRNRHIGLQVSVIYDIKKELKKFIKKKMNRGIKIPRKLLKDISFSLIEDTDWEVINNHLSEATTIDIVEDYIIDKILAIYKDKQARGLLSEEVVYEVDKFTRTMFGKHKYIIE